MLRTSGRHIHPIVGDGNCLFRALARAVLADERMHSALRQQTSFKGGGIKLC